MDDELRVILLSPNEVKRFSEELGDDHLLHNVYVAAGRCKVYEYVLKHGEEHRYIGIANPANDASLGEG